MTNYTVLRNKFPKRTPIGDLNSYKGFVKFISFSAGKKKKIRVVRVVSQIGHLSLVTAAIRKGDARLFVESVRLPARIA